MDELTLTFLPYPHVFKGERREGMTHPWPEKCRQCKDRQCEEESPSGVGLCSYGFNFQRVDESLLIAGIVLREYPDADTKARRKQVKAYRSCLVTASELAAVETRARRASGAVEDSLASARREVMEAYRDSEQYKEDLVELLRPSLEQTLAQVHDYRQLVSQIIQHVNVLLETKFPRLSLDDQLARANPNIRSIYWAARLMEFKLLSALFLAYPERITDSRHKRVFRLHGAVHKYLQIYRPLLESRGLKGPCCRR